MRFGPRGWLFVLVALGVGVRLWAIPYARFTGDESEFWAGALGLARFEAFPSFGPPMTASPAHHPGPFFYWLAALPHLISESPLAGAAFVALLHGVAIVAVVALVERVAGLRAGLFAAALCAFAPWDVLYSDRIWLSNVAPVFGTLAIVAAARARESAWWQGLFVGCALILPQLHMSAPVAWMACLTILLLSGPARWSRRAVFVGVTVAALAYLPPLISELNSGFSNTRAIMGHAGGQVSGPSRWTLPLAVFGYGLLYATADISYHFKTGYWGGRVDYAAQYFSAEGWSDLIEVYGGFAPLVAASVIIALMAFIAAGFRGFRLRREAPRDRGTVVSVAFFVGLLGAGALLVSARKFYFPHYANVLMPALLIVPALGFDEIARRASWRKPTVVAVIVTAVAMLGSTVRYYQNVDCLNAAPATFSMVGQAVDSEQPVHVQFKAFNNLLAWRRVAALHFGRPLTVDPRADSVFSVDNRIGKAPRAGEPHGCAGLRSEKKTGPRRYGFALDPVERSRVRVDVIGAKGPERRCSVDAENGNCRYGDQSWQRYGTTRLKVAGRELHMMALHPIAGKTVRATLPVSTPKPGRLLYALSDKSHRSAQTPLSLRILQGEQELAATTLVMERGLLTLPFVMTATGARSLSLEVGCVRDGAKNFAFDVVF